MFSWCTFNVGLAEHELPKISRGGNRPHLKSDDRNTRGVEHRILLGIPASRRLTVVRSIVEFDDALRDCGCITDDKVGTQTIIAIQNG